MPKKKNDPEKYKILFNSIGVCTTQARLAILQQDWQQLGKIFSQHNLLQHDLNLTTPAINAIQNLLQKHPSIFGSKISGSGLGDCIIGVGSLGEDTTKLIQHKTLTCHQGITILAINLSTQGVRCES